MREDVKKIADEELCIVVIFFNPTQNQITQFEHLAEHISVIAVDNSKTSITTNNLIYLPQFQNRGIATAQNIGVWHAKEKRYNYIVFFDQDSKIGTDYVYQILQEFLYLKSSDNRIATLGPVVKEESTSKEYKSLLSVKVPYSRVMSIISSGSITETSVFDTVGFFEDALFIDLVDCEWCWRAVNRGYHVYQTRNVELFHTVGKQCIKILGFYFGVSSSFRYFYSCRNLLWLCRRNYVPTRFKVKSLIRLIVELVVIPFISEEGLLCTKNMLKGIWEGIKPQKSDDNNGL